MTNTKTIALLGLMLFSLRAGVASAHPIGISRGEYHTTAEGLAVSLSFSEKELGALHEGANTSVTHADLANGVLRRVTVRSGGERCHGSVRATDKLLPDGVKLDLDFRCKENGAVREVEHAPLFADLARGHRHEAVSSSGNESKTTLLLAGRTRFDILPGAAATEPAAAAASLLTTAAGFVHMGVEHILLGFDHLIFLLGLVVVGLDKRRVLGVVTAFTLAHSLTLALSVLGVWSPPGSAVEPLIALSVAYVGIENFVARSYERRTLVAFAFGLVHGFGFAGALGEVGFDGPITSVGLVGFNLGVELGQLAVLAVLLPLLAAMRRSPALVRSVVPAVNAAVILLGVGWFVLRVT